MSWREREPKTKQIIKQIMEQCVFGKKIKILKIFYDLWVKMHFRVSTVSAKNNSEDKQQL